MYEEAKEKDDNESKNFYKLVKYVKAKQEVGKENNDIYAIEFLKKYKLDLIQIPEEFKDLEVDDQFSP